MKISFNNITYYNTKNHCTAYDNTNINFCGTKIEKFPKDTLENLIAKGYSAPKIASALGVSISYIVSNLKQYGLVTKPRQSYYALMDNIKDLLLKGFSTTDISKLYNLNRRDVYEVAVKVLGKEGFQEAKRQGKYFEIADDIELIKQPMIFIQQTKKSILNFCVK